MGKEKEVALGGFWRDMFQLGLYKRTQGRIARQVTFAALAITIVDRRLADERDVRDDRILPLWIAGDRGGRRACGFAFVW